jgi:hypothetical protein
MGKTVYLRKTTTVLLIIMLVLGLFPLSFQSRVAQAANWPYGTELVANGSFEQIVSGFPANWTPMSTGTSSYMPLDTSLKTHGMQGLKITDDGVGGSREVGVKSDPIPIRYGDTYKAEVKLNLSQGEVHLLVRTYDSSGNQSTQQYITDSTSAAGWQTLSVTFTPPQSHSATAVIRVYERTSTAPTQSTIDEVTMRLSGNLVSNGGFEIDPGTPTGFPVGWLPSVTGNTASVTTETSSAYVSAGSRSVKMVDNSSAIGQVGIKTDYIPIRPGETFDIRVRAKVVQGTIAVLARSFDSNGNFDQIPGTLITADNDWQTVSFSYTPKAPFTSTFVLQIYERSDTSPTTAYVDEVSVTSNELLFNPSFEAGTGTLPEGWSVSGSPAGGVTWVTSPNPIDHGSKAVKITESANTTLELQSLPVKHRLGSTYTASVKANVTSGKATLTLQALNWGGLVLTEYVSTVQSNASVSGWQTLTATVAPPNWAYYVRVILTTDSASADTVVFDSAQLRFGWPITSPGDETMPFRPANMAVSEQNPPDFSWTYVNGADKYELQIASDASFSTIVYSKEEIPLNLFNLPSTLTAGSSYYWRVRYHFPQGWSTWSDGRQFRLKSNAVAFTVPDIETLMNNVTTGRPRILTTSDTPTLTAFRNLKDAEGKAVFDQAKAIVDYRIDNNISPPSEPAAGSSVDVVDAVALTETTIISAGALVYLITNETKYRDFTKQRLMNIITWDPNGSTNYQNADRSFREIALVTAVAYDWMNGAFNNTEKAQLASAIYARTQQLYDDILNASSLYKDPYYSHGWTAAGYVTIIATAMMHDTNVVNGAPMSDHAKKWFRESLPVRINMYPPIGGEEGGWATGTGYWEVSHQADKRVADVLQVAAGINLYNKAFSRNEQYLVPYFMPVGSPSGQFGDTSENPMLAQTVNLLRRQAQVYHTPFTQWSAAAAGVSLDPYKLFSYAHGDDDVEKRPPFELPSARWQKDVGWVAMHSSLYDPERISLYFKSSAYGSYNHNHADQNSFTINAFGEKLAIDAGYYDSYNSNFHNNYYRTTLAHNAITYDTNKGQKINSMKASGRIVGFASSQAFDGTVGDATTAYNQESAQPGWGLDLAKRGIIYVKPNAFVVIDKLDAKGSASSSFEYLLHADNSLTLDGTETVKKEATITKNNAAMKAKIQYPAPQSSTVTSNFTNASDGTIVPGIVKPLQRHAKFTFPAASTQTIISTYQPYRVGPGSAPSAITVQNHPINQPIYQSLTFADGTIVYVRLTGSGLITVDSNFKFDGMAAVVRGSNVLLLDGVRLEKDGVTLLQSNVPATIALSGSELSISGDAPELLVQVNTAATTLVDETYTAVSSGGTVTAGMSARGVHWTKTGSVMTIQSESGRHFKLSSVSAPGPKTSVNLIVKINGTVVDTHALSAHGTYDGGTASYGQLTSIPAGTYTIVSAPAGLILEEGGVVTGTKTFDESPWVILNGAGGELLLTQ